MLLPIEEPVTAPNSSKPVPKALALLRFKVPAVKVTPPAAPELFPLKVNVPSAAFIVVRPSYVLLPDKVVVPVAVTVTLPAVAGLVAAPPFAIVEATFQVPAPPKVRVRLEVLEAVVRFMPLLKVVVEPLLLLQTPFPVELATAKLKIWF